MQLTNDCKLRSFFCLQNKNNFVFLQRKIIWKKMNIKGKITGIKYKIFLAEDLKTVDIDNFNINESMRIGKIKKKV